VVPTAVVRGITSFDETQNTRAGGAIYD